MSLTKNNNHEAEAPKLFIVQFQDSPNMVAFIKLMARQVQELEDAQFEILFEVSDITIAIGEQLDNLGRILNDQRNGRTDVDYRVGLLARINLNLSEGTGEDLIALVLGVVGPNSITLQEFFPAHFDLIIEDPVPAEAGNLANIFVQSAKAAGVRGITHWQIETGVDYFGFDGDPDALGFTAGDFATAAD